MSGGEVGVGWAVVDGLYMPLADEKVSVPSVIFFTSTLVLPFFPTR